MHLVVFIVAELHHYGRRGNNVRGKLVRVRVLHQTCVQVGEAVGALHSEISTRRNTVVDIQGVFVLGDEFVLSIGHVREALLVEALMLLLLLSVMLLLLLLLWFFCCGCCC